MKNLLIKIAKVLFCPLTKPSLRNIKFKDIVFLNPLEHLLRTVNIIKSNVPANQIKGIILDIGAANGGTSLFFNNNFPECKIYGYEPILESYDEAQRKCKKFDNIVINNIGFSDIEEKIELNVTSNFLSSSILSINSNEVEKYPKDHKNKFNVVMQEIINTKILDNEAKHFEKILLIKIDTQGSEYKILSKGIETLKKTKFILIEMNNHKLYNGGCQYYDIDNLLRKNNFKLIDIVVTYRDSNYKVVEYDALYENTL